MKLWHMLSLVALFSAVACCQGGTTLRLSVSDPLYPKRPAETYAIDLALDAHGFPARYSLHLVAATCFDGKCQPLDVTLHWDAIGRYAGLDTTPSRPLSRKEHDPFTKADYERLNEILGNLHSILGRHPLEHFVPVKAPAAHTHGVDAVTTATPASLRSAVVPGAAYSSWVLWRWVHGEIVGELQARTRESCNDKFLLHCLGSRDSGFVAFALDELLKRDALTPAFELACYQVLEDGGRANCERALRALASARSDPATVQGRIIRLYGRNCGSSALILNYLEELPDATSALWAQLAAQVSAVTGYRDLDGALELLKRRAPESPAVRKEIQKLARHADQHVAMRAREFLRQSENRRQEP